MIFKVAHNYKNPKESKTVGQGSKDPLASGGHKNLGTREDDNRRKTTFCEDYLGRPLC